MIYQYIIIKFAEHLIPQHGIFITFTDKMDFILNDMSRKQSLVQILTYLSWSILNLL